MYHIILEMNYIVHYRMTHVEENKQVTFLFNGNKNTDYDKITLLV